MFILSKKSKVIVDHSTIDIEAEIQKFLNNGGKIETITETSKYKKYKQNNINIAYSEEQNSTG